MSIAGASDRGDDAADDLLGAIDKAKDRLAVFIPPLLTRLDTDKKGRVLATRENISSVDSIIDALRLRFTYDDGLTDAIAAYVEALNAVARKVLQAFSAFNADRDVLGAIATRTKGSVTGQLLDSASYRDMFGAMTDALLTGIVTGSTLEDIAEGMVLAAARTAVDADTEGLVRSTPTIMQRAQTVAAAESGGVEFYLYQGRPIDSTREFCRDREGHVWHVEEIRQWGRDAAAGDGWEGMVEGTDERTIFTHLGGWYGRRRACRHVLVPVLRSAVPENDKARMVSAGLW